MPRQQAARLVLPWHTLSLCHRHPTRISPDHTRFPATHRLMPPHACFSTAWTSDSLKFTVAAQEGALAIWDVRSSVPVWVFWAGLRGPPFVTWKCALIEPLLVCCELNRWDDQSCSSLSSFLHHFASDCILDS
ncbi:hypothetical protein JB92DRAFT_2870954 [Gautieria morchelliformis]|nr:hypothetical protein JB92DRAFT_2870954 [Gautieria morchelliformis]